MDREITLVYNLRATITIPDDIKNEDEVREYLNRYYYNIYDILDKSTIEDYELEEIENCPSDEEDIDAYIDEILLSE